MKRYLSYLSIVAAIALTAGLFVGKAKAKILTDKQAIALLQSPIFTDPGVNADVCGTTPEVGIPDCTTATEQNVRRLIITNSDTTDNLCYYFVAAAAACGTSRDCDGSGSDDGNLLLPQSSVDPIVACDLRLCLVGSASPTAYHVSDDEI